MIRNLSVVFAIAFFVVACGGTDRKTVYNEYITEVVEKVMAKAPEKETEKEAEDGKDGGDAETPESEPETEPEGQGTDPEGMGETPPKSGDPEEDEEQEPEVVEPEVTQWGMWNKERETYDVAAAFPEPAGMTRTGSKPASNFAFTGVITGKISPEHTHLTEPMIHLQVNDEITSINAGVSFLINGEDRSTLARYGARLEDDGTFDSFSTRENGMAADGNPAGFNGAFFGEDGEAVAGHVVTQHVFGTYTATVD